MSHVSFRPQRKLHEMRRQRKERVAAQMAKRNNNNNNNNNNTPQRPDTIRLNSKVQQVKDLRAGPVLKLFGQHFLAMARASNRHRAYPQAYMYLLLAGNMATLLDETANNDDAIKLRKQVEQLNVASRGGVRDMLGSSWSVNEQHDLVPSTVRPRGSNWEFNKPPPPQPPPEHNSVFGVDRVHTAPALHDLDTTDSGHAKAARTFSTPDSDLDIMELPIDSPPSPIIPPLDPTPLPITPPHTDPQPPPTTTTTTHSPQHLPPTLPDSDVPDASPSSPPPSDPALNFLSLRDEDTDDDDDSTDL